MWSVHCNNKIIFNFYCPINKNLSHTRSHTNQGRRRNKAPMWGYPGVSFQVFKLGNMMLVDESWKATYSSDNRQSRQMEVGKEEANLEKDRMKDADRRARETHEEKDSNYYVR